VSLLQHVTLYFSAGGLRNSLYRNDLRNLQARMLVHKAGDRLSGHYKLGHSAAVQDEYHELFALGAGLAYASNNHFAEFEAGRPLCNILQVIGIVVLPVDNDDFLCSPVIYSSPSWTTPRSPVSSQPSVSKALQWRPDNEVTARHTFAAH